MRMTLAQTAACLSQAAQLKAPVVLPGDRGACRPCGAAIDSRAVRPGDIFFCLPGAHVDGHDFAPQAVAAGAAALVVSRPLAGAAADAAVVFMVHDVTKALGLIAAAQRAASRAAVIGITGTAGKTSVKEALATVLAQEGVTAKNPLNLNNQIGLPLSILNADDNAAFWVFEAGISQPEDMDELGAILRPDIALILNVGPGHVQGLGNKGVAHYKARLLDYVAPEGRAVISADYPELIKESARYPVSRVSFSTREKAAEYTAVFRGSAASGGAAPKGLFQVHTPEGGCLLEAPFLGEAGAENVAAVTAVAHTLGFDLEAIAAGLKTAATPAQRFSCEDLGAVLLIDDSYNANPLSMARTVESAARMAKERDCPLTLVLGEMGELGADAAELHETIGAAIAAAAPCRVIWKGGQAEALQRGLHYGGYAGDFHTVKDAEAFAALLQGLRPVRGVYVFKGSRSNRLETLVSAFRLLAGYKGDKNAV